MKTQAADLSLAQDTFLNNQGMESLSKLGRDRDPAALREVARQFESMFLQQMLKSMRSAGDVFAEDNFMNSSDSQFYRDMYDQQLSLTMSTGQGMGIAEAFYQQMIRSYGDAVDDVKQDGPTKEDLAFTMPVSKPARSASSPAGADSAGSAAEFIEKIRPYANWAASVLDVNPKAIMAQAALETGWGEHIIRDNNGASSHNLFNIKATPQWSGKQVEITTTEYEAGQPQQVQAGFRHYDSLFSAFSDYVSLLQKPRYQQALAAGNDTSQFAQQLQQAGYATDPAYAQKIQRIVDGDILNGSAGTNQLAANLDTGERR